MIRTPGAIALDSRPMRVDVYMRHGDTWSKAFTFNDETTLAGRSFACQIRTPTGTLIQTLTVTVAGIVVTATLSAAQSALLTPGTDMIWDLQETTSGVITTRIAGKWNCEIQSTQ